MGAVSFTFNVHPHINLYFLHSGLLKKQFWVLIHIVVFDTSVIDPPSLTGGTLLVSLVLESSPSEILDFKTGKELTGKTWRIIKLIWKGKYHYMRNNPNYHFKFFIDN